MSDVQPLFGPMFFGAFINTFLYGVLVLQTFIYNRTYKNDAAWIRYLTHYLFFVETLNTAFDIATMYEPLILRFGSARATTVVPVMLEADHIMTVMISTPVQLFIAWRIKIISKSNFMTGVIVFFAICSFAGGLASTISTTALGTVTFQNLQKIRGAIITWLASAALADLLITVTLVYSLYRGKTGFKATDDTVNRIIRFTIQTGMLTSIFASMNVILFLALPKIALNFLFALPLCKLYTNSLLSSLNARAGWNNLNVNDESNVLFGPNPNATLSGNARPTDVDDKTRPGVIATGVYELDMHTSMAAASRHDLESGASSTSVVDTPLPEATASVEKNHCP